MESTAWQSERCLLAYMDMIFCPLSVGYSMMQQKIDRLEELATELSRNLNKREDKALDYKR